MSNARIKLALPLSAAPDRRTIIQPCAAGVPTPDSAALAVSRASKHASTTRGPAVLAYLALSAALGVSAGCEAVVSIFEAGLWVGVILVLVVLGIVAYVVSRFRGGGGAPRGTVSLLLGALLTAAL